MSKSEFSCCGGSSCCDGAGDTSGLNRRDFFKTAAASGVGLAALFEVPAAAAESDAALAAWNDTLLARGESRVYRGDELKHIAMPLGGIGAGQVYLRGDGSLNPWQNFNNFNSNASVPGAMFAVRAQIGTDAQTRLLQLSGGPQDAKRVESIEFTGEYPFAWVRYVDAALPVQVSLEAFSPFIPLNTKDSGLPAVVFRFRVRNTSAGEANATVLAAVPNLIGWDGYGRPTEPLRHSEFGGNTNTIEQRGGATVLVCGSAAGTGHSMAAPVRLHTNDNDAGFHMRHCRNVTVKYDRPLPASNPVQAGDVYWASDINGRLSEAELASLLAQVEAGASAVLVCDEFSLIHDALNKRKSMAAPDLFEDFESGTYANWQMEGEAFGDAPATGTYPGQQPVSGWQGTYYLNSWAKGDGPVGTARSREFSIEKRFIHFLVGGGQHAKETCVNLVIDGQVVASEHGQNTEQLRPVRWDVSAHVGKKARIEIVDANTGGWGHVLVDHIQFSDSPRLALSDPALAEKVRHALPFTASSTAPFKGAVQPLKDEFPLNDALGAAVPRPAWSARRLRLKKDAVVLARTRKGVPLAVAGSHGAGRLVVCNGPLNKDAAGNDRKAIIGALLQEATRVPYAKQTGMSPDSPLYGTLALGLLPERGITPAACAQAENVAEIWDQFSTGSLQVGHSAPSAPGTSWVGALSGSVTLAPNEERTVTFVLAWHLPNRMRDENYGWGPDRYQYDHRLGNRYNTWFKSAADVIEYIAANEQRLTEETRRFHTTFYNSTLPQYFLDAVTANASILRSPIYVWLEDGTVGGFEGADRCCPMNCTHVYNYAMTPAYLFPPIEQNVRETDLLVQMHPTEHYIPHRTVLPLSLPRLGKKIGGPEHPALDGELGTVLKTYREWLMCGDREWLGKVWERVRTLMTYIMNEHDADGDGVIKGEQPNTYDTHLFGSNTFIGTLYLAALRAAEEMALVMNEKDTAAAFRDRFEKGRAGYDATCWDGEYYYNVYDAPNADAATYNSNNCYGPGCFSDQLFGQWWAHVVGLGYVLPRERVQQALRAIYRHNWRSDLTNHKHTQRVFATGNEKGLLVGSWPKGGRPERPILYCDEVWTGIEYHVAATMLCEGMITEALQIVRGARDRYTGNQRNPWSEIECGQHYARAMSSYSLLLAASGFLFNAGNSRMSIGPRLTPDNYKAFFTAGSAWGAISQRRLPGRQDNAVEVRYGRLALNELVLDVSHAERTPVQAVTTLARKTVASTVRYDDGRCVIRFKKPVELGENDTMRVEIRWT